VDQLIISAKRFNLRLFPSSRTGATTDGEGQFATETEKLRESWTTHPAEELDNYLVVGYHNPRINAQSILVRHFLVEKVFGTRFDDLAKEELKLCVSASATLRRKLNGIFLRFGSTQRLAAAAAKLNGPEEEQMESRWRESLAGQTVSRASLLELACEYANNFRFLHSYGLANHLDYVGIDLSEDNIANARRSFPGIDFRVANALDLPCKDGAFDYVLAFDVLEHLAIQAMDKAIAEATRVARKGVIFAFFNTVDEDQHAELPFRKYHVNQLSRKQIEDSLCARLPNIRATHIPTFLRDHYGRTPTIRGRGTLLRRPPADLPYN